MRISDSNPVQSGPDWRKALDYVVETIDFQRHLSEAQGSAASAGAETAQTAATSSKAEASQAPADVERAQTDDRHAAASTTAPEASGKDSFGRTAEEARAQVAEWQRQEAEIDSIRRQMGLPPINRGYTADYNPQNLDLKTMQPHGWVPVDPAVLAREQSIKDAAIYLSDSRQFMGKPIIEAQGFAPDVIEEARRRAGLAGGDS